MKFYVKIYIGHIPADGVTRSNKMRMIEFSVKYILVEGRFEIMPNTLRDIHYTNRAVLPHMLNSQLDQILYKSTEGRERKLMEFSRDIFEVHLLSMINYQCTREKFRSWLRSIIFI